MGDVDIREVEGESLYEVLRRIEGKIDNLDKIVRNGMSSKIASHSAQLTAQWFIMGAVLVAIIGLAFSPVVKLFGAQ